MSLEVPTSDAELLALLRIAGPLSVRELADAMEVTATAVRQRLVRLLGEKAIQREVVRHGRGRPRHRYSLTEESLRRTDSPFTEVASTFWEKTRQSSDPALRRDTLRRIARVLMSYYAGQIQGEAAAREMKSLAKRLDQQQGTVAPESPAKPRKGITPERLKAVSQMIKAMGGFDCLREMLAVIKEVGGVTRLKELLES
jgi:predicted ArsR family transcriptional regulator